MPSTCSRARHAKGLREIGSKTASAKFAKPVSPTASAVILMLTYHKAYFCVFEYTGLRVHEVLYRTCGFGVLYIVDRGEWSFACLVSNYIFEQPCTDIDIGDRYTVTYKHSSCLIYTLFHLAVFCSSDSYDHTGLCSIQSCRAFICGASLITVSPKRKLISELHQSDVTSFHSSQLLIRAFISLISSLSV